MLLVCLLLIVIAVAGAFIDFRLAAVVLAIIPAGLALLRAMPSPWGDIWANRSKGADIVTCLVFAVLLVGLAFVVPQSR